MLILKGGIVVSMDPAVGTLPAGDVLVDGDRIAAVGPGLDAPSSADVIDAQGMIVMPGFVNAHIGGLEKARAVGKGAAGGGALPRQADLKVGATRVLACSTIS